MQTYPPGTRIGQYEIASRPMMGGMGVVYFALDHGNDGHPVALKTFRPELLPDRAARDRFLREGTAWIELGSHPHIVRCYKVEYIDPTAFLVLELIAKEQNMPDASLRSWLIPGRPLPLEQALLFALQIARGMQYATEKIPGFVHRDLKPQNILVGADKLPGTNVNRLRVTDFGLVKTISDSSVPATTSTTEELKLNQIQFTRGVGTPLYMAPEQWKGESVGIYTDVYAFGCILHEMLSGHCAAKGNTITELEAVHCDGKLQLVFANLPEDISVFLAKCLKLNLSHRFISWSEIVDLLGRVFLQYSKQPISQELQSIDLSEKERVQTGLSYNAIGSAYMDIGKIDVAVHFFKQALVIGQNEHSQGLSGAAIGYLGLAFTRLGNLQEAIRFQEQSLNIARNVGSKHDESSSLANLGNAHLALGNPAHAIELYEQALKIYRNIGDARGAEGTLGNLGNAYSNLGDIEQAVQNYEMALDLARKIGNRRGEGASLGNLSLIFMERGDFQRAIEYQEQFLKITRQIGNLSGEGAALGNLGVIYKYMGDVHRSIQFHEQALKLHREIGEKQAAGKDLVNLGNMYSEIGNTKQALWYYEQDLEIEREIRSPNGCAIACYNISSIYEKLGDIAHALPKAQEALQIFIQIGSPNAKRVEQLIERLQGNHTKPTNPIQPLFNAFISASSFDVMRSSVAQYPFMLDESFINGIEESMKTQVAPKLKPLYEQRLDWLKQLANK